MTLTPPQLPGVSIYGPLGDGSYSNVWQGKDANGLELVIKGPSERHPALEIAREAQTINAIHEYYRTKVRRTNDPTVTAPGIITVAHTWGSEEDSFYLATPFISDETLEALSPWRTRSVVRIGMQMLDTLAIVHKAGFSHYDLKLDNWMNTSTLMNPSAVLIDFSSAKNKHEGPTIVGTQFELPTGTPGYFSPQQLLGKHDPRADVYAVGVNMYRLLTGMYPYTQEDNLSHIQKILAAFKTQFHWDPLRMQHKLADKRLLDSVATMLSQNPDKRPDLLTARNTLADIIKEPHVAPLSTD